MKAVAAYQQRTGLVKACRAGGCLGVVGSRFTRWPPTSLVVVVVGSAEPFQEQKARRAFVVDGCCTYMTNSYINEMTVMMHVDNKCIVKDDASKLSETRPTVLLFTSCRAPVRRTSFRYLTSHTNAILGLGVPPSCSSCSLIDTLQRLRTVPP
jgi:hypothetical protein